MKKLLVVSLVLFVCVFMNCGGDDSGSPEPEPEVSPFLFNRWAKGQTIITCDSREFPSTFNYQRGFSRLVLSEDFTYERYLLGDLSQSGTFQVDGVEISFDPPLLTGSEIISTNFTIVETSFVINYEVEDPMTGRCIFQDRYIVADD